MIDAFDADVLIFAAAPGHELGVRVRHLISSSASGVSGRLCVGSVLLIPETLTKPQRSGMPSETLALARLLGAIDLLPVERSTAALATELGVSHGLKAPDAIHLASALEAGADRLVTNNSRDYRRDIAEIDIVYPADLPQIDGR